MVYLFTLLFLASLICLPVALIKPSLFRLQTRMRAGLVVGGIILVLFILSVAYAPAPKDTTTATPSVAKKEQVTSTTPIPKRNIVISSVIVKKVAPTTYRYFFNIANNDTTNFNGTLYLQLYDGHDKPQPLIFGGAPLSLADSPVLAGLNKSTYIDDSHAPSQVDGIDGATTFSYTVSIGDSDVASGKDNVSTNYESDL